MREAFRIPGCGEMTVATWPDELPDGCPPHAEVPYAMKAYALKNVADAGDETLLWCDACILPGARPLTDLWEKIERDGVWLANNGFSNYEWTADFAYPELFREELAKWGIDPDRHSPLPAYLLEELRKLNKKIPHVVATAFGISLKHPKGRAFLDEYYRLASETKAFCGPWTNLGRTAMYAPDFTEQWMPGERQCVCGPPDVRGHRHDQSAASVIAWRLGVELTDCPEWFSYRGGETDKTCLIADGSY
jgi:hypothetical protein